MVTQMNGGVSSSSSAYSYTGVSSAPSGNLWAQAFRRLRRKRIAVAGFCVFLLICLACIMAPWLTKWDYWQINARNRLSPPSAEHIFGTDNLGRDVFSRLLYGGRITLRIALVSASLAMAAGGLIGLVAGYFGDRADMIISPVLDILASVPVILLALTIESIFGWGRGYFMYAIILAAIPQFARLVRAAVMDVMGCEYIEAARALGVGHTGIILRHVLHNVAPLLITRFTSGVAETLLTCTIMGYLSIGVRPPTPEWGAIVFNAKEYMRVSPIMMVIPCAVIAVCVLSVSLFGDGLRDALDPRQSGT